MNLKLIFAGLTLLTAACATDSQESSDLSTEVTVVSTEYGRVLTGASEWRVDRAANGRDLEATSADSRSRVAVRFDDRDRIVVELTKEEQRATVSFDAQGGRTLEGELTSSLVELTRGLAVDALAARSSAEDLEDLPDFESELERGPEEIGGDTRPAAVRPLESGGLVGEPSKLLASTGACLLGEESAAITLPAVADLFAQGGPAVATSEDSERELPTLHYMQSPTNADSYEEAYRFARESTKEPCGRDNSQGLYVVDGTNARASHRNVAYRLFSTYRGVHRRYFAGPNLVGNDIGYIEGQLYKAICEDLTSGAIRTFGVIGYSRGAMIAAKVAAQVEQRCPKARNKAPWRWAGFIDAVNTGVPPLGKISSTEISAGVSFVHVIKDSKSLEDALTVTATLTGGKSPRVHTVAGTHAEIGCWDKSRADAVYKLIANDSKLFTFDSETAWTYACANKDDVGNESVRLKAECTNGSTGAKETLAAVTNCGNVAALQSNICEAFSKLTARSADVRGLAAAASSATETDSGAFYGETSAARWSDLSFWLPREGRGREDWRCCDVVQSSTPHAPVRSADGGVRHADWVYLRRRRVHHPPLSKVLFDDRVSREDARPRGDTQVRRNG
jgi:hypothetical protein